MKTVAMALYTWQELYKRIPPAVLTDKAGRPLCSWRFKLVPFMEGIMLDVDFGSRWDDTENRCALVWGNHLFCWGNNGDRSTDVHTNVVAITGEGTAFDPGKVLRLPDIPSDTILAVEVAETDTYWMEPGDMAIEEIDVSVLQGIDGTGTHVIFADGSVWFLSAETPLGELKEFCTIDGARQYDRDEVLGVFHEY
jgi:hypothetical protein